MCRFHGCNLGTCNNHCADFRSELQRQVTSWHLYLLIQMWVRRAEGNSEAGEEEKGMKTRIGQRKTSFSGSHAPQKETMQSALSLENICTVWIYNSSLSENKANLCRKINKLKCVVLPVKGLGCLLDRFPPAVRKKTRRPLQNSTPRWHRQVYVLRERKEICAAYLCYFEEFWYSRHSSEKLLVNVQAFFTLGLLHVKVFLCLVKQISCLPGTATKHRGKRQSEN